VAYSLFDDLAVRLAPRAWLARLFRRIAPVPAGTEV
jgi:hypothetical protein